MTIVQIAPNCKDISRHIALALKYRCGLELQSFSDPDVLDNSWPHLVAEYRTLLRDFPGPLSCHGAFFDLSGASFDARVVALTRERYLLNLEIASQVGATHVIFHTNFLPMIRTEQYRRQWVENERAFLRELAPEAAQRGISIAMENMWDPDPYILAELLDGLALPNVGVCLDVSHAYLYQRKRNQPVEHWIEVLAPHIIHVHMNNTRGVIDEHLSLNAPGGAIQYGLLLSLLTNLERRPWLVVEVDDPDSAERSLVFMQRVLGSETWGAVV
ncbi:MAG: sugar phosphate isomerase/epimerase [Anaerolineae bacterium]|nr:sugar phosphate isomerase/epimerase [Anaerolineae bacterium]